MKVDFFICFIHFHPPPATPEHSLAYLEKIRRKRRGYRTFVFNVCAGHKSCRTKRKLQGNVTNHTQDPCFAKISSRRRYGGGCCLHSLEALLPNLGLYIPQSPILTIPLRIHVRVQSTTLSSLPCLHRIVLLCC